MNPQQPKKILIIEDEVFIADLYSRQLIKAGYSVITINDGLKGLATLNSEKFDLLLLDIMLPGMNGLEILRGWKLKNPNDPMITLLLTNLGQDTVIKQGFDLGAQGYLIKAAYTPDQVIAEVQKAFEQKSTNVSETPQPQNTVQMSQTQLATPGTGQDRKSVV